MGRVKDAVFSWPPPNTAPIDLCSDPLPADSVVYPQHQTQQHILSSGACFPPSSQSELLAGGVGFNGTVQSTPISLPPTPTTTSAAARMLSAPLMAPTTANSGYYPMVPLSSGGFIFNYPPMYSQQPILPFSQPMAVAIPPPSTPSSNGGSPLFPSSPILTSPGSCPTSPIGQDSYLPVDLSGSSYSRKEKLDKYRQKRNKRNWNRPVDQARRERAQARPRDDLGHFVTGRRADPYKERMLLELGDVKNKLEAIEKESKELKDKLSAVQHELQEHQKLNSQLLHENRILWSSVPVEEVFNTVRPNAPFADAFKEKIDFSSIELNLTQSQHFAEIRENEEFENKWIVDSEFNSGSFS